MKDVFDLPTGHIFEYWNEGEPSKIWMGLKEEDSMRMIEWNGDGRWKPLSNLEPLTSLPDPKNFVDHGKACDDIRRV